MQCNASLLDPEKQEDSVFWAILLTGFFLLLRKSNLVPDTQNSFNGEKQLTRKQVKVRKHCVKITVFWSKTIQFHQRKLQLKIYRIKNSPLCPVQAFKKLFKVSHPHPDQSCFLCADGLPFSYNMLNYRIRKYLKKAGVRNYKQFSAHLLRWGGLLAGFRAGLPKEFLKILGDWRSQCFEVYLSFPKETRDKAAKLVRDSLMPSLI